MKITLKIHTDTHDHGETFTATTRYQGIDYSAGAKASPYGTPDRDLPAARQLARRVIAALATKPKEVALETVEQTGCGFWTITTSELEPKPFGWDIHGSMRVRGIYTPICYHYRGVSEAQARSKARMKAVLTKHSSHVSIDRAIPLTLDQWVTAYGLGRI